jgi:sarcosine oxidase delta subunit
MAMGEGMRRAGDRADISSDEEDELEAARRNWPRTPLTGAALAIARLWLGKARKRRAFSKLVRGIIDKNVKGFCEVCSRTPEKNNVKLSSYLATRGEPDQTAIDRLIGGFETQFGASELDPNLWKAYFRANAEFCTRCSICENAMEQEKLLQQSRAPGESRLTRPEDISSDEEDDDPEFEPLVVTRSSPEGRMMSKWLVAARRKLGGRFPRESAFKDTEKYSRKLKQLKTKKAKTQLWTMVSVVIK